MNQNWFLIFKHSFQRIKLLLRISLLSFGRVYSTFFGLIVGTNFAHILVNIYVAMLDNELRIKCIPDPKFKWYILFIMFIDDVFGVEGLKFDVEYWIEEFNLLRKSTKIAN